MPPITSTQSLLLCATLAVLLLMAFFLARQKIMQLTQRLLSKPRRAIGYMAGVFARNLQRFEHGINNQVPSAADALYEELTPLDNGDDKKIYDEQLNWAIRKKAVCNIGITGTFGSGKSTVVKTFQKNHKEFRYLNISLASFPYPAKKKEGSENIKKELRTEPDGQLIEFSILQQIILHIHHNRLPGSRFHRIRHQERWKTFLTTLGLTAFSLAALFLFDNNLFKRLIGELSWKNDNNWLNILPWIFVAGFLFISYSLLRIYANSMISKLKIPAAEFEVEKKETSVLNRQIEEILYFFEVTSYDVVVIEDLDRFGSPEIFTKLREINQLINNAQQVRQKVVFIYVLGDHIFQGESRTKFFDYILPVIPVVNSSNAYQLLKDRIKKAGLNDEFPEHFIDEVSLYITDMRLLKNIMNEFILYHNALKKDKKNTLNVLSIFSIVMYKNLCPEDFALLQMGEGIVVEQFKKKQEYARKVEEKVHEKIKAIQKLIDDEQSVQQASVEELRTYYITKWLALENKKAVGFEMNSANYSAQELITDDFFAKLIQNKVSNVISIGSWTNITTTSLKHSFKSVSKIIDPHRTYEEKEQALQARFNGKAAEWRRQLAALQNELLIINSYSLKELINRPDINPGFDFKGQRSLQFLLSRGYINEEYPYYISHFYPGSLLETENEFILSVKERRSKEFTYALANIPAILRRLYPGDFAVDAILNIHLLDYLLKDPVTEKSLLTPVIHLLSSGNEDITAKVDQYLQLGKSVEEFTRQLSQSWPGLWNHIQQHPSATEEAKHNNLVLLVRNADVSSLVQMNNEKAVSAWLADLRVTDIPDVHLITLLSELDVKLARVEQEDRLSPAVSKHIYMQSRYLINRPMLKMLLSQNCANTAIAPGFDEKPYSSILDSGLEEIKDYIDQNLNEFAEGVMLTGDTALMEEGLVIKPILNSEKVAIEYKTAIIAKMQLRVASLRDFERDTWAAFIDYNKALPSWNNMSAYQEIQPLVDPILVKYVNDFENGRELAESFDQNKEEDFTLAQWLLNASEVSDPFCETIIQRINRPTTAIDFSEIPVSRLDLLIKERVIPFDKDHFKAVNDRDNNSGSIFMINNIETALSEIATYGLNADNYVFLLHSSRVSKEQRAALSTKIPATHFENSTLAQKMAHLILEEGMGIQFSTRMVIINYCHSIELKSRLAILQLETEPSVISDILKAMGGPYASLAEPDQKIGFTNTAYHRRLFELLRGHGFIHRMYSKENSIHVSTTKSEDKSGEE